ncbi:hypothetical protein MY4824_003874 [Beauveria thailandica]
MDTCQSKKNGARANLDAKTPLSSAFQDRHPSTANRHLANPSPLGFGGFATTLMTLSLSMMGFRGVANQTVFVSNLCFLAGLGLLISAQWEMMKGNTFAYTVLAAFGLYYGGYGMLLMPSLGVSESYGGETAQYYSAFAFYQLGRSPAASPASPSLANNHYSLVLLELVLFNSLSTNVSYYAASCKRQSPVLKCQRNVPNIVVYAALELCYILSCTASFMRADGRLVLGDKITQAAALPSSMLSVMTPELGGTILRQPQYI